MTLNVSFTTQYLGNYLTSLISKALSTGLCLQECPHTAGTLPKPEFRVWQNVRVSPGPGFYTRSSATAEKQRVSCPHGGN